MIGSLLRHELEAVGDVSSGILDPNGDDRGHPSTTVGSFWIGRGLVQPRSARERASVLSSDVSIGTHRIYLEGAAIGFVDTDMRIVKSGGLDPDLDGTYRIIGEVANAAGFGHHLEIAAERIDQ